MIGRGRLKQSIYLTEELLAEIKAEAERLDRSLSWVLEQAYKIARSRILASAGAPK